MPLAETPAQVQFLGTKHLQCRFEELDSIYSRRCQPREFPIGAQVECADGIVSGVANWGVILLTSIFFLVEATAIPRKVKSITDEGDPAVLRIVRLTRDLRQYVAIEAGVDFLTAVVNVILLVAIGVDFALLWGVLAFFLSFVPAVGIFIAIVPPALMALIQFGVPQMLIVIVGYIIISFVAVNHIKPRFVQKTVNISVLVTFLSLILWGWVRSPLEQSWACQWRLSFKRFSTAGRKRVGGPT